MKKLFGRKGFDKEKFIDFFDRKGFYIILAVCIAVIAATAVFVNRNPAVLDNEGYEGSVIPDDATDITDPVGEDGEGDDLEASSNVDNDGDSETAEGDVNSDDDDDSDVNADPTNGSNKGDVNDTDTSGNAIDITLDMPVFGEITLDYAMNKLIYSKTLEDWRTHSGIDISSSRGTAVKAAADGFVYQIKTDPRYGSTIILSHDNGVKTVYANLASTDSVVTNQNVKKGDVIGSIGNSALFEIAEPAHLHFEVLINDEYADPKDYLPK
jgi:murein DD-endopeptidase MepM/ murein hydrolase activator NlpD